ncbi:hypothetical protein NPX25_004767 [Escherichia coli]|nr:hypothetical protein [Escherichia coli]EJN3746617.1 hypothetical protein [Escherichia coli]EJN3789844.1 hypothetical protein [Escherichia coli]HAH3233575.1 hypothetical protein [Escherichia coli]
MALCKSDKDCLRNRETSPFWCADVLVSVQWNEAAIVRLLTVSVRFSGKGMAAVCYRVRACFHGGLFVLLPPSVREDNTMREPEWLSGYVPSSWSLFSGMKP